MNRKHMLLLVAAAALAAVAIVGCGRKSFTPTQPGTTAVHARLYGVIHLPRTGIPLESRPERVWRFGENTLPIGSLTMSVSADSSEYVFKRTYPVDSLTITLAGRPATIHPDGSFDVSGVPLGVQTLVFSLRGEPIRTQTVNVIKGDSDMELAIERVVDTCCPAKPMRSEGTQAIPCLDNNGVWPGGFTNSDCFTSLIAGPPWYSWMCWSEAMDKIHDHHGNIWCDGSHNCSLFVHGWGWNKQFWHRHTWPWIPQW